MLIKPNKLVFLSKKYCNNLIRIKVNKIKQNFKKLQVYNKQKSN